MKKYIITTLLLFAALCIGAQPRTGSLFVTPRVGAMLTNITNEQMGFSGTPSEASSMVKGKTKLGLMAGADLQYQLLAPLAVSAGVYYQQMGCRYPDTDLSEAPAGEYSVWHNNHNDLHYLSVPVMAHLYVAKNFSFDLGLQPSFLIGSRMYTNETTVTILKDGSYNYTGPAEEFTDKNNTVRNVSWGIPVGLSYEHQNVVVSVSYLFGLTRVYKSEYLPSVNHNRAFCLSAGYRFTL